MALRVDSVLLVLGDKRGMYCAGAAGARMCVCHSKQIHTLLGLHSTLKECVVYSFNPAAS